MGKYGGTVIHHIRDEAGPIEIVETLGVRALHFGTEARQSALDLADPERLELSYLRAMLIGLVFVPVPERILLLGLGGGSLARFLVRHYPDARIEVIELRAAMVDVARRYFGLPDHPGLSIQIGDGGESIMRRVGAGGDGYDLILIDIFDDRGLAPSLMRPEVFEALPRLLKPRGVAAINLWNSHPETFRAVMHLIKRHFPAGALSLPVPGRGNVIGIGLGAEATRSDAGVCRERARLLQSRLGIEFTRMLRHLAPPWRR
jgi:spermidine synthase